MIKSLTLHNFKTYKESKLEFFPKINVITGESGHGKTNILRALNWLVNNRPLGSSIIRRGQENSSVVLTTSRNNEEYTIKRIRGKSENVYQILAGEKEVRKFTSFGSLPPEDVSKLINLSDINIQPQLKPYFLVLDSPGQVAIYIRSLIRLDEIDRVVKCLSSKTKDEKFELLSLESSLQEVKDELEELSRIDLEKLERLIFEAKNTIKNIQDVEKRKSNLEGVATELRTLEAEWILLPEDIDQKKAEVELSCCKFIELLQKVSRLQNLSKELKRLGEQEITLPDTTAIFLSMEGTREQYNDKYKRVEVLLDLRKQIQEVCGEVEKVDRSLLQLEKEEQQLMEQLDSCPYCGLELTVESKECLLNKRKV